jgi:hypothetical protein
VGLLVCSKLDVIGARGRCVHGVLRLRPLHLHPRRNFIVLHRISVVLHLHHNFIVPSPAFPASIVRAASSGLQRQSDGSLELGILLSKQ